MSKPLRTEPDLAAVVALAQALQRDEQRPARELQEREHQLAPTLPSDETDRVTTALAWLEAIEGEDPDLRSLHERAETAIRVTDVLIAVAAIVIGWATTLAAFYFDGSGRVNAVAVLALLVLVPAVLLIPFFAALLPVAVMHRIPGADAFSALARAASPGRLGAWLWRRFARGPHPAAELAAQRWEAQQQRHGGVHRWAFLRWSQWFALWFQLTVFTATLGLVVFTDLAFGWSTTLTSGDPRMDAQRLHQVTSTLAIPWRSMAPGAEPSLALVEQSRFFRAASEPLSSLQAARLGGWWAFVAMTIAFYGVLPRVLTLLIARMRLRAAARAMIVASPGVSAVVRRLHRARVETSAVQPELGERKDRPILLESGSRKMGAEVCAVINWSGVPVSADVLGDAFPRAVPYAAGGAATVADDEARVREIAAAAGPLGGDVLVLVKAWEPPLMEFVDFVKALRAALPPDSAEILVLPVGLGSDGALNPPVAGQFAVWRDQLARVGDPSLRVVSDRQEVAV